MDNLLNRIMIPTHGGLSIETPIFGVHTSYGSIRLAPRVKDSSLLPH